MKTVDDVFNDILINVYEYSARNRFYARYNLHRLFEIAL